MVSTVGEQMSARQSETEVGCQRGDVASPRGAAAAGMAEMPSAHSGCDALVGVMESAKYRRSDEFGGAIEVRRRGVRDGRVAVESLVRSMGVVQLHVTKPTKWSYGRSGIRGIRYMAGRSCCVVR